MSRPSTARPRLAEKKELVKNYRVHPTHRSHSPVKFDLHGLPPTLIQTGQCEVLHDQQVRLARAAAAANTPTTLTVFRDMPHVSPIFSFCHELCGNQPVSRVHAIEQASRRWRGGGRERAVKF